MGRVVVLGSLNLDLVTQVERHPEPGETVLGEGLERLAGGKGANQAMAAAAAGADVLMVGAVGDDDAGRAYVERLHDAGIDTSAIAVLDDEPTGTALIVVGEGAENTIVVVPGANGRVERRGADGRRRDRRRTTCCSSSWRSPSTRSPRPAREQRRATCASCSTSRRTPTCPPR